MWPYREWGVERGDCDLGGFTVAKGGLAGVGGG